MSHELHELEPEIDRSEAIFKITMNDDGSAREILREDGKVFPIDGADVELSSLLLTISEAANRRTGDFDKLLNSMEIWTLLFRDLVNRCPAALKSGMLQGLVDLDACMHDLTARAKPRIIANRPKYFDGGVRWRESYFDFEQGEKNFRLPTKKPIRRYEDTVMAQLVVAYEIMLTTGRSGGDDEDTKMMKLLGEFKIHNIDGSKNHLIKVGDLATWRRNAREARRQLGLRYEYRKLIAKHAQHITFPAELSQDERAGREKLARDIVAEVSCRLPTNDPVIDPPDSPMRPPGAPSDWMPSRRM